jgi:hypothetical protein
MTMLTPYMIGADARCTDGACGQVSRVVVAPATMTATHLVVKPEDRQQLGRLVPLGLVDTTPGRISLRCTMAEFYQLSRAEKMQFVPGTGAYARHGPGQPAKPNLAQVQSRPDGVPGRLPQTFTYDVLPAGEVAVRGGDPVHAIDGDIGHITGVAIDAGSRQVAYVLLHAGHLLGRKNIAVPISAVTKADAGIQLDITRQDVKHLPPVNLQQPDG